MFKLKQGTETVFIGKLYECWNRLKQECRPDTTMFSLQKKGWQIVSASHKHNQRGVAVLSHLQPANCCTITQLDVWRK